jgi:hypothetical protein
MHLRSKHVNTKLTFKGTVSQAIQRLKERHRIEEDILGSDYSVLVDGKIAGPDTEVGDTLTVLHAISGG